MERRVTAAALMFVAVVSAAGCAGRRRPPAETARAATPTERRASLPRAGAAPAAAAALRVAPAAGGGVAPRRHRPPSNPLLEAIIHIYVNVYRLERPQAHLPPSVHPVSVGQAAATIMHSNDPLRNAWRRVAIAALAARGLERHDFQQALATLQAPSVAQLRQVVAAHLDQPPAAREHAVLLFLDGVDPPVFAVTSCWAPGGAPQSEDPTVQADENEIAGVGTACVTPNIGCVGKRMDPQSWEKCPDLVFVQSHVAQAVGGTISYDQNCDVAATTNPPPPTPGTTWSAALFEHFQIPLTPTWFKNLIWIDSSWRAPAPPTPGEYKFTYSLPKGWSLCSQIIGQLSPRPDGLTGEPSTAAPAVRSTGA